MPGELKNGKSFPIFTFTHDTAFDDDCEVPADIEIRLFRKTLFRVASQNWLKQHQKW